MYRGYMTACGDIKILLALGCTGCITHIWWSHECVLLSLFVIYTVPRMCSAAPCYEYNKTFLQHGLSCIYIKLCFRDISEYTVGFKICVGFIFQYPSTSKFWLTLLSLFTFFFFYHIQDLQIYFYEATH